MTKPFQKGAKLENRRHPEREQAVAAFVQAVRETNMGEWIPASTCWFPESCNKNDTIKRWLVADGLEHVWHEYKAKRKAAKQALWDEAVAKVAEGAPIGETARSLCVSPDIVGRLCRERGIGRRRTWLDYDEIREKLRSVNGRVLPMAKLEEVVGCAPEVLRQAVDFGRVPWVERVGRRIIEGRTVYVYRVEVNK